MPDAPKRVLVLIHGTSLDAPSNFGHVISRFANHSQVICPDYSADKRPGNADQNLSGVVDRVVAQIRSATDTAVDLVGDSLGSVVAAAAAARHPGLVRSLVLIAPWADASDPRHDFVFSTWGRLQATAPEEAARFALSLSISPAKMAAIPREDLDAMVRQPAPAGTLSRIRLAGQADLVADLPNVTAPTLIVRGSQDYVIPAYQTAAVEALIPDVRTEVLDSGHALLYEQADNVVRLVNEFSAGHGEDVAEVGC
ncbi:alpha/beta fold hydrolase [Catenulispora sp. EB89]|uniref:alpha/beta fold hydrolase n=1 Tax=Catenulispora sp. EB89 TaxID=3156257 RepID=UPI003515E0E1